RDLARSLQVGLEADVRGHGRTSHHKGGGAGEGGQGGPQNCSFHVSPPWSAGVHSSVPTPHTSAYSGGAEVPPSERRRELRCWRARRRNRIPSGGGFRRPRRIRMRPERPSGHHSADSAWEL